MDREIDKQNIFGVAWTIYDSKFPKWSAKRIEQSINTCKIFCRFCTFYQFISKKNWNEQGTTNPTWDFFYSKNGCHSFDIFFLQQGTTYVPPPSMMKYIACCSRSHAIQIRPKGVIKKKCHVGLYRNKSTIKCPQQKILKISGCYVSNKLNEINNLYVLQQI